MRLKFISYATKEFLCACAQPTGEIARSGSRIEWLDSEAHAGFT